jgi:chorismate synthase
MLENSFGEIFRITTFGESHGPMLGVVIDGMPARIKVSLDDLQNLLDKRRPGLVAGTTSRNEKDRAKIVSGVFEEMTLGTPLCVLIENTNQRSEDYQSLKNDYRPGHADKTTMMKFGFRDHRGGGRSSGRETVSRVIAGYFASLIIPQIQVRSFVTNIGPIHLESQSPYMSLSPLEQGQFNADFGAYHFPEIERSEEIKSLLLEAKKNGESYGGSIRTWIKNCPGGLGGPVFKKLKSKLGEALLSIGACTSFEYGPGVEHKNFRGRDISSDPRYFSGIEGGISNGDDILLQVSFKAPSTVGEKAKSGRHDPCIVPRAVVVVEAMVLMVLADFYLQFQAYKDFHQS